MYSKTLSRYALGIIASAVALAPVTRAQQDDDGQLGFVSKLGIDVDVRSGGRILADDLAASGRIILPDADSPVAGTSTVPQIQFRAGNVQANSAIEDYAQIFSGFRPFVRATQSEVSTAAFGRNIVVTYNDST